MSVESLIVLFGYPALFIGAFLEGETVLVMAGYLAHRGYLSISTVMIVAFIGAFLGDQFWFHAGRTRGRRILARHPRWQMQADRVRVRLERHQTLILLGFRFVIGTRTITPLLAGTTGIDPRRFVILNAAGAALWSLTVGGAGYIFGHSLEILLHEAHRYEWIALCTLAVIGLLVWFYHRLLQSSRNRKALPGIESVRMPTPSAPADPATAAEAPRLRAPQPPYVINSPRDHLRPSPASEWLLTTGHGGFAMGTASGVNRRKYHGLLIATTNPPVDRLSCLASLDEALIFLNPAGEEASRVYLSCRRYTSGVFDPNGPDYLVRFEKEPLLARWIYRIQGVEIIKELTLAWRRNACSVRYILRPGAQRLRFLIEPRITLRDFHSVNTSDNPARCSVAADGPQMHVISGGRTLTLCCERGLATVKPTITRDVLLDLESERHQEDVEHLFNPGWFEIDFADSRDESHSFTVFAALSPDAAGPESFDGQRAAFRERLAGGFLRGRESLRPLLPLVDAADDYLVPRTVDGKELITVLAGFPWFTDWGRDTMISLFGLMLVTRRFDDARGALETFARHRRDGLIPNVFDDHGGPPQYNTVDASLWFLHACVEYLRASGERAAFDSILLPACTEIIDHYRAGTRFNIRMDPADGLIESGDETTQLTWMDAKRDGVVFTPRHGKPVEINALWHHGLLTIAGAIESVDAPRAADYRALSERVAASFREKFWNEKGRCLYDCLQRDASGAWRPRPDIRPNQIFAVSLEHSPLSDEQKHAVVDCVRRRLLTPFGLRTLAPDDPNYQPRFEGDMMSRDRAYHNGTVWPWLIGPYCEAVLRVGGFSAAARSESRAALQPLLDSLMEGCVGQIAEVYDAEPPRRPQGCIAQAWSIAEVLRAAAMVQS